jgi:hypothetical protein
LPQKNVLLGVLPTLERRMSKQVTGAFLSSMSQRNQLPRTVHGRHLGAV